MSEIVGSAYLDLQKRVKSYAEMDKPVLFVGETGSGKEMFAKLYMKSTNQLRPGNRRAVNCSAFTEGLLGSEVFGHVEGAFTGAKKTRWLVENL